MDEHDLVTGAVLEEACLSLEELAAVCSVSTDWVVQHVEEGALEAPGGPSADWRFTCRDLWRVRQMHALERDFDAVPELAALFADLLEEMDVLRARLRRAGLE